MEVRQRKIQQVEENLEGIMNLTYEWIALSLHDVLIMSRWERPLILLEGSPYQKR